MKKKNNHSHKGSKILSIFILIAIMATGLAVLGISTTNLETSISGKSILPIECGNDLKLPGCENTDLQRTFKEDKGTISIIEKGTIDEKYIQTRLIPEFVKWFIGFISGICIIVIMIGGFKWMTALGDNSEEANKTIAYGLIGLVLALVSFAIINIVNNLPSFISSYSIPVNTAFAVVRNDDKPADNAESTAESNDAKIQKNLDILLPESPTSETAEGQDSAKAAYIANSSISFNVIPWIIDILLKISKKL